MAFFRFANFDRTPCDSGSRRGARRAGRDGGRDGGRGRGVGGATTRGANFARDAKFHVWEAISGQLSAVSYQRSAERTIGDQPPANREGAAAPSGSDFGRGGKRTNESFPVKRRKEAEYKFRLVVNCFFSSKRKYGEG